MRARGTAPLPSFTTTHEQRTSDQVLSFDACGEEVETLGDLRREFDLALDLLPPLILPPNPHPDPASIEGT
jgi:hypothetical protein